MKTLIKISLLCIISLCLVASVSFAQEATNTVTEAGNMTAENEDMAAETEMYFASGSVVEATATEVIISEYDFDAGQETQVAYQINAQTQLEGVASAADIKAGDDIEIEYQLSGDQKIATRIEKYAPEATEDIQPISDEAKAQASEKMNEETQQRLQAEGEEIETNN